MILLLVVAAVYGLMHLQVKRAVDSYDRYGQKDHFIPR